MRNSWRRVRISGTARRKELDRNIRLLYIEVFWAAIFMAVMGFSSTYALRLGASNTLIGYLSSVPSLLAMAVLVPAARLLESTSNRAPLMNWSLYIGRAMFLGLAIAPWVSRNNAAVWVVAILIIRSAPMNVFDAGFTPMLVDMIPARDRAQIFANRNIISSATTAICSLLFGQFLDATANVQWIEFPGNYQILITLGGIAAILSSYYVSRMKIPPSKVVQRKVKTATVNKGLSARQIVSDMRSMAKSNPGFVRIVINTLVFNLGAWLVMPLYMIFFVNNLNATDGWIGLNSTLANIGVIGGQILWSKIIARKGDSKALLWSIPISALYAFLVAFFPNLTLILLFGILINLVNPGVNLSHFNILVTQCPEERRTSYLAVFSTVMNAGAFVAPMVGVAMSNVMEIRWVLLIGGLIRLFGAGMFYIWRVDTVAPSKVENKEENTADNAESIDIVRTPMTGTTTSDFSVKASYCDYRASDDEVYETLVRTTESLSRTWEKLESAQKIAIKFNQDWPHEYVVYEEGQRRQLVSDKVARAVLRLLRERTSAQLVCVDASYHVFYGYRKTQYETIAQTTTLADVLREYDVPCIDGTQPPYKMVSVPGGGQMFEQYYMLQDLVDADAVVSVAKMKNHAYMGVTGCLKNLFGLMPIALPGRPRHYFHHLVRMPYMLTDIGRIANPALNIVDGLIGQAGSEWGEEEDVGRKVNALIAGDHVIATDAIMAHIMGHDPAADWLTPPFHRDRNALRAAADSGFGTVDLDKIDWTSEVEPQPEGSFFAKQWDSQDIVVTWIRTMCEQGLYYRDHQKDIVANYANEFILLQDGEVKWHSPDGIMRVSRRELAGKNKGHAMFLKYADPEEREQEHFEVYERGLAMIERMGV